MTTRVDARLAPRASAMFARTSAVQQMMGASRLTLASPVIIPTLLGAEALAEREELLVRERLDRARVERDLPLGERLEVQRDGDQRLARAGRRVEDDVLAGHQLEDRLLLGRVERQAGGLHPGEEALQQDVRIGRWLGREQIGEGGHRRAHPSSGSAGVTGAAGAGCRGSLSTLRFTLEHTDGLARAGVLHTRRGDVPTPVFMPVATHAAFRHVSVDEAGEAGSRILLGEHLPPDAAARPGGVRAAWAASTASWGGTAAC